MARQYIPTKRCDRLDRHEWPDGHGWSEGPFKRWCPGRNTTKQPSRSRRKGHPRNPKKS